VAVITGNHPRHNDHRKVGSLPFVIATRRVPATHVVSRRTGHRTWMGRLVLGLGPRSCCLKPRTWSSTQHIRGSDCLRLGPTTNCSHGSKTSSRSPRCPCPGCALNASSRPRLVVTLGCAPSHRRRARWVRVGCLFSRERSPHFECCKGREPVVTGHKPSHEFASGLATADSRCRSSVFQAWISPLTATRVRAASLAGYEYYAGRYNA
jgi:hypothetical protein